MSNAARPWRWRTPTATECRPTAVTHCPATVGRSGGRRSPGWRWRRGTPLLSGRQQGRPHGRQHCCQHLPSTRPATGWPAVMCGQQVWSRLLPAVRNRTGPAPRRCAEVHRSLTRAVVEPLRRCDGVTGGQGDRRMGDPQAARSAGSAIQRRADRRTGRSGGPAPRRCGIVGAARGPVPPAVRRAAGARTAPLAAAVGVAGRDGPVRGRPSRAAPPTTGPHASHGAVPFHRTGRDRGKTGRIRCSAVTLLG